MTSETRIRLFHRTRNAAATNILHAGFRDATGSYMADSVFTGVWVSTEPLSENEGAYGDVLLANVGLCEEDVAP